MSCEAAESSVGAVLRIGATERPYLNSSVLRIGAAERPLLLRKEASVSVKTKKQALFGWLLMIVAVIALLCGLIRLCNYLLMDDSQSYTRLTMHELYERADAGEEIDTLFLGSSHCYRAYDPELYEELTGRTAYNLGSSSQNYDTSYYLLREAARLYDLKTVYLDMYYKFLFIESEDLDLVQANLISDYMRPSLNKLSFLLTTTEAKNYTNRFFPFRRSWQELGDFAYVRENLAKKQAESYRKYEPVTVEADQYAGRGFVWSDARLDVDAITWWDNFGKVADDMQLDTTYPVSYIEKIVSFCREHDIRLVFVTAPSLNQYLEAIGPYDSAHAYVQKLAERFGVEYLDFNLAKTEYLELTADDYIDVDHLNGTGAEKLTLLLTEADGKPIDEYFNACYDDKYE